jgi:hypothetical protein
MVVKLLCAAQPAVTLQGFGTTLTVAYHTVEPKYGNLFSSMRMLVTSGDLRLSVSGGRAAGSPHCCSFLPASALALRALPPAQAYSAIPTAALRLQQSVLLRCAQPVHAFHYLY